jgi:hypothetical protein
MGTAIVMVATKWKGRQRVQDSNAALGEDPWDQGEEEGEEVRKEQGKEKEKERVVAVEEERAVRRLLAVVRNNQS